MKRYPMHIQLKRATKSRCPSCASSSCWYDDVTVDAGTCWQHAGCHECYSEWNEVYTMTSVQDLDQDTAALAEAQAEAAAVVTQ